MRQAHGQQGVIDPRLDLGAGNPPDLQAISHIFENRGVENAGAGEHQGDPAPQCKVGGKNPAAVPVLYPAAIGFFQQGQGPEQGGFAAAVGTLQHVSAPTGEGKRAIPENGIAVVTPKDVNDFQL